MSKVIFKLKFKHPNLETTRGKNAGHVFYIGTRPGTDKTITKADLEKELNKSVDEMSSDEDYITYINERPLSHGLFGQEGIEDPHTISKEVFEVTSFVWRGVVSLTEDDAKQLGYLKKDKWQDLLRKKMPDLAYEMKIPWDNFRWVGAVHMEKGHPHAHVVFWEKVPKKVVGVVSPNTVNDIRKMFVDEVFEEERQQLLTEKNIMRDLIRDLSNGDMGNVAKLIKEVRATGKELKALSSDMNVQGIEPKLYSEEEMKLAQMVQDLSKLMPGKGRANLKFMPEDVKEEVYKIADYMLSTPEFSASLEKSMISVESLTKMYTGKKEAIDEAKNKAYKDIRDRISQVILKCAIESQKDNLFYVDKDLSMKVVSFIDKMNYKFDVSPERIKVLSRLSLYLVQGGYSADDIKSSLLTYVESQNLKIDSAVLDKTIKDVQSFFDIKKAVTKEEVEAIIKGLKGTHAVDAKILNTLLEEYSEKTGRDPSERHFSQADINQLFSAFKTIGADEDKVISVVTNIINEDVESLRNELEALVLKGLILNKDNVYSLSGKGVSELLLVKDMDKAETSILQALEKNDDGSIPVISFEDLAENHEVLIHLKDKDPDEIKLGKYDAKIRTEFGKENSFNFGEYKDKLVMKYTNNGTINDLVKLEKVDTDLDIFKKRLDKLTLYGFVKYDRELDSYHFLNDDYFEYDEESEEYIYTDEALELLEINTEIEFTRYDANITLGYIDKAEANELSEELLEKMVYDETANTVALTYYEKFTQLIAENKDLLLRYIQLDENGLMTSNEDGNHLGRAIRSVEKFIKEHDEFKLPSDFDNAIGLSADPQLKSNVAYLKSNNFFVLNEETAKYELSDQASTINKLLYHIYKAGGGLAVDTLKDTLESSISNKEAERQYKYILKRMNALAKQGYLIKKSDTFHISDEGRKKRMDLLNPQRDILRKNLKYLSTLGLIEAVGQDKYTITDKYYSYSRYLEKSKEDGNLKKKSTLDKSIADIFDKSYGTVDLDKIHRTSNRIVTGKYINNEYQSIETEYDKLRAMFKIDDLTSTTLNRLSITLLVSGISSDKTLQMLKDWNIRTLSNIPDELLENCVERAKLSVEEDIKYGKVTVVSPSQWKDTFKTLGVAEKDMPKWMYKGENWKSFHRSFGMTLISDMWKSVWRELERQRMQTESHAEHMKLQLNKQQALQSKSARIEEAKKALDRSAFYRDEDELEK